MTNQQVTCQILMQDCTRRGSKGRESSCQGGKNLLER